MVTHRQLMWIFLILTVLPCSRSMDVSIPQEQYETARGSNVALTCSFNPARPDYNTLILSWEAYPDNPEDALIPVATFFLNNPVDIGPVYEGRASLDVDIDQKTSTLTLTDVTMEDNRRFQCTVQVPNDDEGTIAATTSLLVLVAPSPPVCKIVGEPQYWHNITITCKSEEGSPPPTAEWKTYSVENIQRPLPPKATQNDGTLHLYNISKETSGFFICTSSNRIASATCNVTLAVVPGSMGFGSTAIIIIGVLAGVIIIGVVIFCCCRKKGEKEKNVEGVPGDVYYDKNAPETGEEYSDNNPNREVKQSKDVPQNYNIETTATLKLEDDRHSYNSGKEKGGDSDSRRYRQEQQDQYRGSRDRLDDKPNRSGGSRDRLDERERDRYDGSRDRLDDQRDHYRGSRDRLDDQRNRYGGSRDRLDDQRDRYGGSRDRLDDQRDRYGGSRDRLDDQRDRYGGSRDRLDDQRDRYSGSRDRLDDQRNRHGGSRDRLDDRDDRYSGGRDYRGSRDHIDYADDY